MRDRFIECMKMMYGAKDVEPIQLRDLVRTFSMGYAEALMAVGDRGAMARYIEEYRLIAAETWMPGNEWKWWPVIDISKGEGL